jgi:hypothetical protein
MLRIAQGRPHAKLKGESTMPHVVQGVDPAQSEGGYHAAESTPTRIMSTVSNPCWGQIEADEYQIRTHRRNGQSECAGQSL